MSYFYELTKAMTMLAERDDTLFVGQQVRFDGQRMHASFENVPMERRIEMPVAENFQMGFCTGLALSGRLPVCIFPRMDFLIIAMDQLVNHLDKLPLMGPFKPKVIIRTAIGATSPLNPGPQHTQDHHISLAGMLKTIPVLVLEREEWIASSYKAAMERNGPTILIELMEKY